MADVLFYLSLILIWIMLLYHMFLMQGGFQHYLTYEKGKMPKVKSRILNTDKKVSVIHPNPQSSPPALMYRPNPRYPPINKKIRPANV
ncbi:hypothetical protein BSAF29S_05045 [Bacillus safensis subsp. safensis]